MTRHVCMESCLPRLDHWNTYAAVILLMHRQMERSAMINRRRGGLVHFLMPGASVILRSILRSGLYRRFFDMQS